MDRLLNEIHLTLELFIGFIGTFFIAIFFGVIGAFIDGIFGAVLFCFFVILGIVGSIIRYLKPNIY